MRRRLRRWRLRDSNRRCQQPKSNWAPKKIFLVYFLFFKEVIYLKKKQTRPIGRFLWVCKLFVVVHDDFGALGSWIRKYHMNVIGWVPLTSTFSGLLFLFLFLDDVKPACTVPTLLSCTSSFIPMPPHSPDTGSTSFYLLAIGINCEIASFLERMHLSLSLVTLPLGVTSVLYATRKVSQGMIPK